MGKIQAESFSTDAALAGFVGAGTPTNLVSNSARRIYLHEVSVAPRGADFAADVELYLFDTYTGYESELVTDGDMAPNLDAATYTSDFTADVDGWADIAGAAMTVTANETVDGEEDCLLCIADAGGDESSWSFGSNIWGVSGTAYELKFDYHAETGSGLSYWGGGLGADNNSIRYAEGAGQNVAVVENAWTTCKLYVTGGSPAAQIYLSAFTTINGQTADTLAGTTQVAFKNATIRPLSNKDSWTQGEDWVVNFSTEKATKGTAATTALAQTLTAPVSGELYKVVYTLTETASGVTPSFAGTAMTADAGAGTHTSIIEATNTTADLTFTADASAVVTIDDVSVKKMGGVGTSTYLLKDAIRSGTTAQYKRTFEAKQPWSRSGFGLYATSAGTSCIMDMVMVYEVV